MALWNVYVGCFTEDIWTYYPRPKRDTSIPSVGIERLVFDDESGGLRHLDSTGGRLSSPQYLTLHPTLPVLYTAEFARPGHLTSFDVRPDGRIALRSTVDSLGAMASAVSVHPTGTYAYVSHLGNGVLTACPLRASGEVVGAELIVSAALADPPDDERGGLFSYGGGGAKYHQIRVTPNGQALVVADVGHDEVVTFKVEPDGTSSSEPMARVAFPPGTAPRHIEFHPAGGIVYVLGEQDGQLHVLEARDSVPVSIMGSHSVTPPGFDRGGLPTELQLHPQHSTLYVGVRGPDCVTAFDVDETGRASVMGHEATRGRSPRAVRIDPSGRHLLVGHWQSNDITVFTIDAHRLLRPVGQPIKVRSPSSIVFAATPT